MRSVSLLFTYVMEYWLRQEIEIALKAFRKVEGQRGLR